MLSKPPRCSDCHDDCEYLDEISELRQQVDELSEQVLTDALTGLYNYRHLMWAMNQEIERLHRGGGSFSIIVLDFDDFKLVNDNHGHEFGNQALKTVGTFLQRSLRKLDVPCRFGGEEFVLVLPSTELRDAVQLAERIREGVTHIQLMDGGQQVPLTVSMGVDVYRATERITANMFLGRADQFLLQAKQAGKNRVYYSRMTEPGDGMSADERSALMDGFDESPKN